MKAYKKTKVAWAKTQTRIVKLLNDRKIWETRFTNLKDKFVLEFKATNADQPIAVRINNSNSIIALRKNEASAILLEKVSNE